MHIRSRLYSYFFIGGSRIFGSADMGGRASLVFAQWSDASARDMRRNPVRASCSGFEPGGSVRQLPPRVVELVWTPRGNRHKPALHRGRYCDSTPSERCRAWEFESSSTISGDSSNGWPTGFNTRGIDALGRWVCGAIGRLQSCTELVDQRCGSHYQF